MCRASTYRTPVVALPLASAGTALGGWASLDARAVEPSTSVVAREATLSPSAPAGQRPPLKAGPRAGAAARWVVERCLLEVRLGREQRHVQAYAILRLWGRVGDSCGPSGTSTGRRPKPDQHLRGRTTARRAGESPHACKAVCPGQDHPRGAVTAEAPPRRPTGCFGTAAEYSKAFPYRPVDPPHYTQHLAHVRRKRLRPSLSHDSTTYVQRRPCCLVL